MAKRQVVGLNTTTPRLEAAQAADTYQVPRDAFWTTGVVTSEVADGAAAVAFTFTSAAFITGGAKVIAVNNDETEVISVDKDGKLMLVGKKDIKENLFYVKCQEF